MVALAADFRLGTPAARTAFLFARVGLAGCDMGACTLLPRMIGQGRAAELLYTGRAMTAEEGAAWGFFSRVVASDALAGEAQALARSLADGPTFAHGDDQDAAPPGVGDGPRRRDRSGGPGAGDLHADRGFPPRVRSLRREGGSPGSRATD